MHCVWLGLINTYNVVGNQASRACVIIGEHFGLQCWTKSLPQRCLLGWVLVCVCVCRSEREWEWEGERERDGSLQHSTVMLSCWNIWMDRFFVTTVRAHLTRFDAEEQTNTKTLSPVVSVCQQAIYVGLMWDVGVCVSICLTHWANEMWTLLVANIFNGK